uniref:Uncharacterized protein n=1 Tax=Arundo donax TaxID=35708 RepID=A0A0A9AJA0_ARUDO
MLTVKGAPLRLRNCTISVIRSAMSARNRPADGTGLLGGELYTSAFSGTVALTVSPRPASLRACWMFCRAGKVTFRNVPLKDDRKGSFPTATYLIFTPPSKLYLVTFWCTHSLAVS